MAISLRATLDILRSVAFGSITNAFLPIGTPLGHQTRIIHFINDTDGGVFISTDGVNNMLYIPAGSFILYDVTTNRESGASTFVFAVGTQFYVKYNTAPTKNSFYLACLYGDGE
jgi:hypothetical protein